MARGGLLGKLAAPPPSSFLLLMKTQGVQGWMGGVGSLQTLTITFQMAGSLCTMWEVTVLNLPQRVSVSL